NHPPSAVRSGAGRPGFRPRWPHAPIPAFRPAAGARHGPDARRALPDPPCPAPPADATAAAPAAPARARSTTTLSIPRFVRASARPVERVVTVEFGIEAALRQKLGMGARLGDAAPVQHIDAAGIQHSRKTMCD